MEKIDKFKTNPEVKKVNQDFKSYEKTIVVLCEYRGRYYARDEDTAIRIDYTNQVVPFLDAIQDAKEYKVEIGDIKLTMNRETSEVYISIDGCGDDSGGLENLDLYKMEKLRDELSDMIKKLAADSDTPF